jgi:hypothetical protein
MQKKPSDEVQMINTHAWEEVSGNLFRGAEPAGDRRVFWYNPATGGLEDCVVKSLKVDQAASHSGGWEGWKADASREISALLQVAGVPGVVRFLRMVWEENGAVHLILE